MPKTDKPAKPATAANIPAKAPAQTPQALTEAQVSDLLDKSQHGDKKAWSALKTHLAKAPDWETLYPTPAEHARACILDAVLRDNHFVKEAWDRRARAMIKDLAGPNPTPLERILCERVATCWLDMSLAEMNYASRAKDGMTFAAGEYYQKQEDRAHKRYLTACLALAKVRRLLAPVAQQINIAQPGAAQLNIAQPAEPATLPATLPAKTPATVEADSSAAH
ncbi:MAG: hypothetical protein IVW57_09160 [Ktedonobacterales bacterium]|nr:hypothetical protein [Ktedonobacterales bacterium]